MVGSKAFSALLRAAGGTLILSDFFSSLITVSLSSSFTPRPSASVISALTVDALVSTGGVWTDG